MQITMKNQGGYICRTCVRTNRPTKGKMGMSEHVMCPYTVNVQHAYENNVMQRSTTRSVTTNGE